MSTFNVQSTRLVRCGLQKRPAMKADIGVRTAIHPIRGSNRVGLEGGGLKAFPGKRETGSYSMLAKTSWHLFAFGQKQTFARWVPTTDHKPEKSAAARLSGRGRKGISYPSVGKSGPRPWKNDVMVSRRQTISQKV